MRIKYVALVALLFSGSGFAADEVYKCKSKDGGTIYSQNPCGSGSQPVKVKGTRAAVLSDSEIAGRKEVFKSTDLSDAAIAERNCIAAADASVYGPSRARISDYERQISSLNERAAHANNNLAGATLESGIRSQIAGLMQAIATERAAADSQMDGSRRRCADEKRRREEAIEQRYKKNEGNGGSAR